MSDRMETMPLSKIEKLGESDWGERKMTRLIGKPH